MKYIKDGVIMTNNNPVCDSLFIKQGWQPVIEELVDNEDILNHSDDEMKTDDEYINSDHDSNSEIGNEQLTLENEVEKEQENITKKSKK